MKGKRIHYYVVLAAALLAAVAGAAPAAMEEEIAAQRKVLDNPQSPRDRKIMAQIKIGLVLEQANRPDEAVAALRKAIQEYPQERFRCAQAMGLIGDVADRLKRNPQQSQEVYLSLLIEYPEQGYWIKQYLQKLNPVLVGSEEYKWALRAVAYAMGVKAVELPEVERKRLLQQVTAKLDAPELPVKEKSVRSFGFKDLSATEHGVSFSPPIQKLSVHALKLENAEAVIVSGQMTGLFLPKGVMWDSDAPTQEFRQGHRIVLNRPYTYSEVPPSFRGVRITLGMTDHPIKFTVRFPHPTTTEMFLVGARDDDTFKIEVVTRGLACFKTATALTLRNRGQDPAWERADRLVDFLKFPGGALETRASEQTEVALLHDGSNLLLHVRAEVGEGYRLFAAAKERDGRVWDDDCIEFFFQPGSEGKEYFHLVVNAAGVLYDSRVQRVNEDVRGEDVVVKTKMDASWNSQSEVMSEVRGKEWHVTLRVPLEALGGKPEGTCRFNVGRHHAAEESYSTWAFLSSSPQGFHTPHLFRPLRFAGVNPDAGQCFSNLPRTPRSGATALQAWKVQGGDSKQDQVTLSGANRIAEHPLNVAEIGGRRFLCQARFRSEVAGAPMVLKLVYESAAGHRQAARVFEHIQTTPAWTDYVEDVVFPETATRLIQARLELLGGSGNVSAEEIHLILDPLQFNHQWRPVAVCFPQVGPTRLPEKGAAEILYRSEQTALSADCVLPIILSSRSGLPALAPATVVLDLPPELVDVRVVTTGHPAPFCGEPVFRENVTVEGTMFKRCTAPIQLPTGVYRSAVYLFARAKAPVGKFLRMGYFIEWDKGSQPERWLDIEVVTIPSGTAAKKYAFYLKYADPGWVLDKLPEHAQTLKRVGLHGVEFMDIVGYDERRKAVFDFCHEQGLRSPGGFSPGYWYPFWTALKTDTDMQALGIDGKPLQNDQYIAACPSYRGPHYQAQMELLKKYPRYGIDTVTFDEEFFGPGPRLCFCTRCKRLFADYMQKRHPNLPTLSLEAISRNGEKHPEHAAAWAQFKADLITDWYRDYRAALESGWKEIDPKRKVTIFVTCQTMSTGAGAGPDSGEFTNCLRDNATRLREGIIQAVMPMAYLYAPAYEGSVRRVGQDHLQLQQLWGRQTGGRPALFPYLLSGGGEMCYLEPQRAIKYSLYEAATANAIHGAVIYHMNGMDGYHWKYMAEALHTIARVEDILWEGKLQELECTPSEARARAVVRGKDLVLLVTHYDYEPVEVTISYPVRQTTAVVDAETGETVATLKPGATSFSVRIDRDRARLFKVTCH